MKPIGVLAESAWAEHYFGSLASGGDLRRRDIMRCVQLGWMQSVGMTAMCDGDGFTIQPEHYREGFTMTEAGRTALRAAPEVSPVVKEWLDGIERRLREDAVAAGSSPAREG